MKLLHTHSWDLTPKEAVAIQRKLAPLVKEEPLREDIETVAGLDVSVRGDPVRAAIVVLRLPEIEVADQAIWEGPVVFPYIPGLLSFREIPAILPALEKLKELPDALMLDAQGIAHPRRFGLACHLGVLMDKPALGVGKSRLVGDRLCDGTNLRNNNRSGESPDCPDREATVTIERPKPQTALLLDAQHRSLHLMI